MSYPEKTQFDVLQAIKVIKGSWRLLLAAVFISQLIALPYVLQKKQSFTSTIYAVLNNTPPLHENITDSQREALSVFKESFHDRTNFEGWLEITPTSSLTKEDIMSEKKIGQFSFNVEGDGLVTVVLDISTARASIRIGSGNFTTAQQVRSYADHVNQLMTKRFAGLLKRVDDAMLSEADMNIQYRQSFAMKRFFGNLEEGEQIFKILHPTEPQKVGVSNALIITLSGFFSIVIALFLIFIRVAYRSASGNNSR